ncbi:MAG: DUF6036 family nucleotidyltransferase [Candidatus Dormibacteria bacterium]
MDSRSPIEAALSALGQVLSERGLAYELIVVGGSALLILGFIQRPTRDVDVVAMVGGGGYLKIESLPAPLVQAVADVGRVFGLDETWVNPGPASVMDFGLPDGFAGRAVRRDYGPLVLHLAARLDQIALKLYAAADRWPSRDRHLQDLENLKPTEDELIWGARWSMGHDPSEGYRRSLLSVLTFLGVSDANATL